MLNIYFIIWFLIEPLGFISGQAKAERPARTYIQQLCEDMGCSPEDLLEAMNDGRSGERGSGIYVPVARHDDDD